ncbi:TetR/AcrR family transcriptional regulator [Nevskia sp.]|uniref:TetR/AcrR family transcriptional regulator n=1 Tax=Nevskia sp. TaxID=1929292 RepID=UPI0025E1F24C|nr:TetR/AcrR family transcriptional regulator [Nevskia sp.]
MNPAKSEASVAPELPGKPRVRDRIFETACDLFYRQGIRAVGVDAIVGEAGTNKMSFYRSFASKDELVAEYLRSRDRCFWQWWDAVVAPHAGNPRAQVEAIFEAHVNKTCSKESRGCGLANAAVEIVEDEHPARSVIVAHKSEIRRRFRTLAAAMSARDPDQLGDALMLLMEGGYLARLTFGQSCAHGGPVTSALKAARTLMDAHQR